jgi:hypothetical protein
MARRAEEDDVLREPIVSRLEADVISALRRKPAHEGRLGGALRALCPYSAALRATLEQAVDTMVRRGSYQRPLYAAASRALAEVADKRAASHLGRALLSDEAGGLATLSAACFVTDAALSEPLARVAMSRHPHLAFAAEVARVTRGESNGAHIANVAPKIKESHRIALCMELFVPLLWAPSLPVGIAPALSVLRDAERHLGRWLVFAEIAVRAGDEAPLLEARKRAADGPSSARAAWALVAWALDGCDPTAAVRPTVELVARLSDRPSADRDLTFLFRLAEARVATARPMLENLAKGSQLADENAVRAALYLARDHGREDLKRALEAAVDSSRREALRGLAVAALYDLGDREAAMSHTEPLNASRQLPTAAWAGLVHAHAEHAHAERLLTEPAFRRIQLGWVE